MDQAKLAIVGDRQTGKTYMALLYAVAEAYQGKRVLWQTVGSHYALHHMTDAAEIAKGLDLKIVSLSRANGRYSIGFPSGGHIHFRPPARKAILEDYDLHILDDSAMWTSGGAGPLRHAERIIRTVCTNDRM